MLSFLSDYTEGAHPQVLQALIDSNMVTLPGYGEDAYCQRAKEKIRAFCGGSDADVYFLSGGTQANLVVISTMLRRYEAVVCADSGHINVHEAGAVEFTGHKIIPLPAEDGKLPAAAVADYAKSFYADESHTHMPFPGMVYISHPTELGTLYTRAELYALAEVCRRYGLRLFMDGARLGYGLVSPASDLTVEDIAACCDVFYIGGTKVGALCGEAVVFPRHGMPPHFDTMVKQQGAMPAKGRLLGVQFDALFTDGLYLEISRHAVALAMELKAALLERGYKLLIDSPTNQQFVILDNEKLAALREHVAFNLWGPVDEAHTAIRLVTSWATRPESIEELKKLL